MTTQKIITVLFLLNIILFYGCKTTNQEVPPVYVGEMSHLSYEGISVEDVKSIIGLLDNNESKILSISYNGKVVTVQTGRIKGLLDGEGEILIFKKDKSKWKLDSRMRWRS